MPGRRREPWERAVIFAGILAALTRDQINKLLQAVDESKELVDSSHRTLMRDYRPKFEANFELVVESVNNPMTWGDLKALDDLE